MQTHEARPNPDAMSGAVFTTCADPDCHVPVWREDDGTVWQHVDGTTDAEREARELGAAHGEAAGSWVLDGNSSEADALAVLEAFENPGSIDLYPPAPLSGEFADGYTLGRLSDELGIDEESDEFPDLCTIFEDAYYESYEREAVRSAIAVTS